MLIAIQRKKVIIWIKRIIIIRNVIQLVKNAKKEEMKNIIIVSNVMKIIHWN